MSYDVEAGIFINEQDFAKYNKKIISIINKSQITKFNKVEQVSLGKSVYMHYILGAHINLDVDVMDNMYRLGIASICYFSVDGEYFARGIKEEYEPRDWKELIDCVQEKLK